MIFIPDSVLDSFISEDVPYLDLTGSLLGIGRQEGTIEFYTREDITVCGTEEVSRIFAKFDLVTQMSVPSGTLLKQGKTAILASGSAEGIHCAWKVSMNILEYCSGISTTTRRLVDTVKAVNQGVEILTTRKSFPGTKLLVTKSIAAGGALPHRLGISETVLVFREHCVFKGGVEGFAEMIGNIKVRAPEKKIIAEAETIEDARRLARAGIDGIQFDKVSPSTLAKYVTALRAVRPDIVILAAGGITLENAESFAKSGVNGIITSSLFHAKPSDMGVRISDSQCSAPER
jgi:molybdenum transport protein